MERFLRYTIVRKIDSGGMASVFLATDEVLHREVAIKMLHPHLMGRPETKKRFENEARAIAKLAHENIIKLFDYGEAEGKSYLVMEYIEGKTLTQLLEEHATIPNLVLLEIFHQIFSGLAAAHEKGICHRDIKPPNIMIDKYGSVKIMDFGIAHVVNQEQLTMTGTFVGSPHYISPEQAQSHSITVKSDMFSAGSVLYECAAGQVPFDGENPHAMIFSIINDNPESACTINHQLLEPISDIIKKLHAKDPQARPDARQCVEMIESLCRTYGFSLGKNRIIRFLNETQSYIKVEQEDIFAALRHKARTEFKQRHYVAALKCLTQARSLGVLLPEDEKIIGAISRGKTFRVAVICMALAIVSIIAGFYAVRFVRSDKFHALVKTRIFPPRDTVTIPAPAKVIRDTIHDTSYTVLPPKPAAIAKRSDSAGSSSATKRRLKSAAMPVADNSYISVKTRPPYAQVYVDGILRGETPLRALPLAAGPHRLLLKKEKYGNLEETVTTVARDTSSVQRDLTRTH